MFRNKKNTETLFPSPDYHTVAAFNMHVAAVLFIMQSMFYYIYQREFSTIVSV